MTTNQPQTDAQAAAATPAKCPLPKFVRRLGLATILFFVIKGLITSSVIVYGVVKGWSLIGS